MFLKALRNISAGEELYCSYGFQYWEWFYRKCHERAQNEAASSVTLAQKPAEVAGSGRKPRHSRTNGSEQS